MGVDEAIPLSDHADFQELVSIVRLARLMKVWFEFNWLEGRGPLTSMLGLATVSGTLSLTERPFEPRVPATRKCGPQSSAVGSAEMLGEL